MLNISVIASGGGTNFQAILDALASGEIENAEVKLLIASNDKAFAIERAKGAGIKTVVFDRGGYVYTGRVAELAAGAREAGLNF